MRINPLLLLLLIALIGWGAVQVRSQDYPAHGLPVQEEPHQDNFDAQQSPVAIKDGYAITPLATFRIKALTLSEKHYKVDREADLSPVDLALGWGPMSDPANLDHMDISQSRRWYYWEYKDGSKFNFNPRHIHRYSANMHMIPADRDVAATLDRVRKNDIVEIEGYLVRINHQSDNFYWNSSMTRNDTGDGSCEVVYVEQIRIIR